MAPPWVSRKCYGSQPEKMFPQDCEFLKADTNESYSPLDTSPLWSGIWQFLNNYCS